MHVSLYILISEMPQITGAYESHAQTPVNPLVRFQDSNYLVNENDGTVTLTVLKEGSTDQTVTVNYQTQDFTAIDPLDYTATNGQLSFDPAVTSMTISIPVVNLPGYNPDTRFFVNLSNPVYADLGTDSGTVVTIVNVDEPPEILFGQGSVEIYEDNATLYIDILKSGVTSARALVNYETVDGTAIAGENYTARAGTLEFLPGKPSVRSASRS